MRIRDAVEKLTFPTVRDRGRDVPDYDAPPSVSTVAVFSVQPGPSVELLAQRSDADSIRWSVWAPADTDLDADSIVRYRGDVLQVDGEPLRWSSITGQLDHVVVSLVAWRQQQ